MSDAQRLYIARKCGSGMGAGYILSSLLPILILFLVTLLLTFALSFISSMASSIDRMIQLMGSGTVYALADPSAYLPSGAESGAVRSGTGLIYAGEGESAGTQFAPAYTESCCHFLPNGTVLRVVARKHLDWH